MNLCRNCKYAKRGATGYEYAKCKRTEVRTVSKEDPVIGGENIEVSLSYCSTERKFEHSDMCGPEGKHFVQKETIWTILSDLWRKLP